MNLNNSSLKFYAARNENHADLSVSEVTTADVIIIGSGVAGLSIALGLASTGRRVQIITKSHFGGGSSEWAQGGIAAAMGAKDSPEQHAADTMSAGAGLNEPAIVRILTSEGPRSHAPAHRDRHAI